jgi:hypothetical protein
MNLQSAIARVPTPVRVILAVWVLVSVGFNVSSPSSTANLSPAVAFIALLPAALVSLGVAIYSFWHGGLTLVRTARYAMGRVSKTEERIQTSDRLIGGIGALNIYILAFFGTIFTTSHFLETYTVSIMVSIGVLTGMIFILVMRKRLPIDVKAFLWSAASVTLLFAVIMIAQDGLPTPSI